MRAILLSNDTVLIGFAQSVLRQAGIEFLVADQHISLMEGSIGAFPRRLLVAGEDWERAHGLLRDAGLASALLDDGEAGA